MSEPRRSTLAARVAELEADGYVTRARDSSAAVLARGDEFVLVRASGRVVRLDPRDPFLAMLVARAEGGAS